MNTYLKNIFIILILCQTILTVPQTYEMAYEHNPEDSSSTQFMGSETIPIQVTGPMGTQTLTRLKGMFPSLKNPHTLQTPGPKYMVVEGHFVIFADNETISPNVFTINVIKESVNSNFGQITLNPSLVESEAIYDTYDKHSGHVTGVKRRDVAFTNSFMVGGNQSPDDDSLLNITIEYNTTITVAVRYLKVSYYSCHPTCSDCDPVTLMCNTCPVTTSLAQYGYTCNCTQQDNLFNYLFGSTFQCNSSNSVPNCSIRSYNKVRDYCQTCVDTMLMQNYFDLTTSNLWSTCVCPSSTMLRNVNGVTKCITQVENECLNNPALSNPDINLIRPFTDNLSTNVKLAISVKTDSVFDQMYFVVEPVISNLPPFTSAPLAFKISIKDVTQTNEIFNILGEGVWTYYDVNANSPNGINIRKIDLTNNRLDCVATQSVNGAQSWKCNIWIAVYNPCSGAVYAKTMSPITLSNGGLVQASFNINQTTANVYSLACIVNNECFYNEKYSASLFACNNNQCSDQRVTQYAPGDYIYIKPTISYQSAPGNFSIGVEYAAFIYKDSNGNEVNTFNAMTELQTLNGGAIIGFRIPSATELVDQYGVTSTGSLYLSFVIRINNPVRLRHLEETRYSLTAANPIMIKIDPKYFDPNYVDENGSTNSTGSNGSGNNTIVIIVVVLAVALVITTIIVSLVILKRRKQQKDEKPVPSNTPNETYRTEKPVEIKEVKIEFEN
jgi:hypothetical protein